MKVQRGDSNEYTLYTISQYEKENHPKLSQIYNYWICSKGLKNEFETAVVNEPSLFEPLTFYCIKYRPKGSADFSSGSESYGKQRIRALLFRVVCPPVRGDNPRAVASGLSAVQADKYCVP